MQTVFLHGFATGPQIWQDQKADLTPALNFVDLEAEAKRIAEGILSETVLVGWSMGGMLALSIYNLAPEKIKALILISTTPKFILSEDFPHGLPRALLRRLEKRVAIEGADAFHKLIFGAKPLFPALDLPKETLLKELVELEQIDLREVLPKIKVPTLIVHGEKDEICPVAVAEYMQGQIKGSELVLLPGIGHVPQMEAVEQFNCCLKKFIENCSLR